MNYTLKCNPHRVSVATFLRMNSDAMSLQHTSYIFMDEQIFKVTYLHLKYLAHGERNSTFSGE